MNTLLADVVGFLNGLIAILIIVIGASAGGATGNLLVGLTAGCVVALLVCGGLALIVDMRNELKLIRRALTPVAQK